MNDASVSQLTPVVIVREIEPVLGFWKKLGYETTATVPHGERLGFAMLSNGPTTVMYQTAASIREDLVASASDPSSIRAEPVQCHLFLHVTDLLAVERSLAGEPIVMPRRTTFYGATETGYRDPAGNIVVFAQFAGAPAS
jgi:hypothetical protein